MRITQLNPLLLGDIQNKGPDGPKNLTVNYNMTTKDVAKMIEKAEQKNSMKDIKAEFIIQDEEQNTNGKV